MYINIFVGYMYVIIAWQHTKIKGVALVHILNHLHFVATQMEGIALGMLLENR